MQILDHDGLLELLSLASAGALEHVDEEDSETVTLHLKAPVEIERVDEIVKHAPFLIPWYRYEAVHGWVIILRPSHERRTVFEPFGVQQVGSEWYYDTPENS